MSIDKMLLAGSTGMLLLKLLEREDMYGYQMIERLRTQSKNVFELKAGTLYPLLHQLEQRGLVTSYEQAAGEARMRKYYHLTESGRAHLAQKEKEWREYAVAVEGVMGGAVIVAG